MFVSIVHMIAWLRMVPERTFSGRIANFVIASVQIVLLVPFSAPQALGSFAYAVLNGLALMLTAFLNKFARVNKRQAVAHLCVQFFAQTLVAMAWYGVTVDVFLFVESLLLIGTPLCIFVQHRRQNNGPKQENQDVKEVVRRDSGRLYSLGDSSDVNDVTVNQIKKRSSEILPLKRSSAELSKSVGSSNERLLLKAMQELDCGVLVVNN